MNVIEYPAPFFPDDFEEYTNDPNDPKKITFYGYDIDSNTILPITVEFDDVNIRDPGNESSFNQSYQKFLNRFDDLGDLDDTGEYGGAGNYNVYFLGTGDDVLRYNNNSSVYRFDIVFGQSGNDVFSTDGGATFFGGAGDDRLLSDNNASKRIAAFMGDGDDTVIIAQSNRDADFASYVRGGAGDDWLQVDRGFVRIFGDEGNDSLYGGSDSDTLYGGAGDDTIEGRDDDDSIYGGDGDDLIFGGGGGDEIYGGAGNDTIDVGPRNDENIDSISLGAGSDIVFTGEIKPDETYEPGWDWGRFAVDNAITVAGFAAVAGVAQVAPGGFAGAALTNSARLVSIVGGGLVKDFLNGQVTGSTITTSFPKDDFVEISDFNPAEDLVVVNTTTGTANGLDLDDPSGLRISIESDTQGKIGQFQIDQDRVREIRELDGLGIDTENAIFRQIIDRALVTSLRISYDSENDTYAIANANGTAYDNSDAFVDEIIDDLEMEDGQTVLLVGSQGPTLVSGLEWDDSSIGKVFAGGLYSDIFLHRLMDGVEYVELGDTDGLFAGFEGDDFFDGTGMISFNRYYGGEDNDTVSYYSMLWSDSDAVAIRGITVDLADKGNQNIRNVASVDHADDIAKFDSIEALVGSQYADSLSGDNNNNWLSGVHGNDTLIGRGGNDVLIGGTDDTSDIDATDPNRAAKLDDDDSLSGGDGDDTLIGGRGADTMDGGDGNDTADYSGSTQGVEVFLDGTAGSGGSAAGDVLSNIETVIGSDFDDTLSGSDADETFRPGAGAAVIDGGDGRDTLDLRSGPSGVNIDIAAGTGTNGDGDSITFSGIEVFRGTGGADTFALSGDGAEIHGEGGNDTANFSERLSDYSISAENGRLVVTAVGEVSGDTLRSVENVNFSNGAFDVNDFLRGAPTLEATSVVLAASTTASGALAATSIDAPDGISFALQAGPSTGNVLLASDGTFSVSGTAVGADSFTVLMTATNGRTATAIIPIETVAAELPVTSGPTDVGIAVPREASVDLIPVGDDTFFQITDEDESRTNTPRYITDTTIRGIDAAGTDLGWEAEIIGRVQHAELLDSGDVLFSSVIVLPILGSNSYRLESYFTVVGRDGTKISETLIDTVSQNGPSIGAAFELGGDGVFALYSSNLFDNYRAEGSFQVFDADGNSKSSKEELFIGLLSAQADQIGTVGAGLSGGGVAVAWRQVAPDLFQDNIGGRLEDTMIAAAVFDSAGNLVTQIEVAERPEADNEIAQEWFDALKIVATSTGFILVWNVNKVGDGLVASQFATFDDDGVQLTPPTTLNEIFTPETLVEVAPGILATYSPDSGEIVLLDQAFNTVNVITLDDVGSGLFIRVDPETGEVVATYQSTGGQNIITVLEPAGLELVGTIGADAMTGGVADDTLLSLGGEDSVKGGDGVDLLDLDGAVEGQLVDLGAGTLQTRGTISGVEKVSGSSFGDTIIGSEADETLSGGDGNDQITGGGGNDSLSGGAGFDVAILAGDRADYSVEENPDSLTFTSLVTGDVTIASGVESFVFDDDAIAAASLLNQAPVITPIDTITIDEDTSGSIALSDNIIDPDGDTLFYQAALSNEDPLPGFLSLEDGTLSYAPLGSDAGTYEIELFVNDFGETVTTLFILVVNPINDEPSDATTDRTTLEDTALDIPLAELIALHTDEDGDLLTITDLLGGTIGTAELLDLDGTPGADTLRYTPNLNENGVDILTYTVDDGNGGEGTGTINLTVTAQNDAPIANDVDLGATLEDTPFTIRAADLLVGVTDVEGDATVSSLELATGGGRLEQTGPSVWVYTPALNDDTAATFTYTVADEEFSSSDIATLDITPDNDAPVLTSGDAFLVLEGNIIAFAPEATDPDGDPTTFDLGGDDASLFEVTQLGDTTFVTFEAPPDFEQPLDADGDNVYAVTLNARDGLGGVDTQDVLITVGDLPELDVTVDVAPFFDENGTGVAARMIVTGSAGARAFALTGTDAGAFEIDETTGDVTFLSPPNFEAPDDQNADGIYDLIVQVTGEAGSFVERAFTVALADVAEDPNAADDAATVSAYDGPTSLFVLENDTDEDAGTDLTITTVNTVGLVGLLTIAPGGRSLVYDTNGGFGFLNKGDVSTESFTYTVADETGRTDTATVDLTIEGEDAISIVSIYDGATLVSRMWTDNADIRSYETINREFDANGNPTRELRIMDNGQSRETNYEDGVRTSLIITDTDDNFNFTTVAIDYTERKISSKLTILDNGVELFCEYDDGIIARKTISDLDDLFSYREEIFEYDESGDRTTATTIFDDDDFIVTRFEDGTKVSTLTTDVSDKKGWQTREVSFDEIGARERIYIVWDDGDTTENQFVDGTLQTRILTDVSDERDWFTKTTIYDDQGRIVTTTFVYDDALI